MLAVVIYFLSISLGLILLKKFVANPIVRIFISPVVGVVFTTWIVFVLSLFIDIQTAIYLTIFLLVIISATQIKRMHKKKFGIEVLSENADLILFLLFWVALLIPLFDSHMIKLTSEGAWQVGGSTYGDLALHLSYINKFSEQKNLSLISPIYSSNQTTYPFLINFFAGLLVRSGATIRTALILTSLPFIIALLTSSYTFLQNYTKSKKAAWIFSFIFLFNGGWGIYYFYKDWLESGLGILEFISNMLFNYSHIADLGIHWSNIIVDYFLPQRGMVIGLSIFSLCLLLYSYLDKKYKSKLRYFIAIIIGLSPFFHIHTFLVMLPLSIWIDIWHIYFKKTNIRTSLFATLLTLLIAFPQFYWQFSHSFSETFMRYHTGWLKRPEENIFIFWLKNLGFSSILWLIAPITALKQTNHSLLKIISLPIITIFIITNFVILQPHDYDNMKFMLMSYYGICLISAFGLAQLAKKHFVLNIFVALMVTLISITGILSYYRESYALSHIAIASDILIGNDIKKITPPESIFLTSDSHNHLVTMIAGRNSVMIHPGWLWTHGISYETTLLDVDYMYKGGTGAKELLEKYKVDFVFIGEKETNKMQANFSFFESNFEKIYSENGVFIYKIKP